MDLETRVRHRTRAGTSVPGIGTAAPAGSYGSSCSRGGVAADVAARTHAGTGHPLSPDVRDVSEFEHGRIGHRAVA